MKRTDPDQTPTRLGYRMPAEWEPHEAVWLAWPHDPLTFPNRVERVEETYLQIIEALHLDERIHLSVIDLQMKDRVEKKLQSKGLDLSRIYFHRYDHADVWFRDYGPIFIVRRGAEPLAMVHWEFNAWGGKYDNLLRDGAIPSRIHKDMGISCFRSHMVLEGGSIDVNGKGTLMTTEQCLLHASRNPGLCREEIEEILGKYLGVRHFIWLHQGICGDDTDGHVDDIARFVNPTTVVCGIESDLHDENAPILRENYERLLRACDQDGRPLTVVQLPMPGVVEGEEGRLPASYANFYIGNRTVLVPVFGHTNDARALEILASLFPDRSVKGIRCEDLVHGLGTLHCITQQQPAPKSLVSGI
jgi:agmatine deiminase